MMLAASALSAAVATAASVFSPSANACIKRVGATRFRYDPYCSHVVASSFACTPLSTTLPSPTVAAIPSMSQAATVSSTSIAPSPINSCAPVAILPSVSVASHQVPTVAVGGTRYAVIKFKQETVTFVAPFRVFVDDIVVVEGDRGENVGVVQEITQAKQSFEVSSKILRKASDKDLAVLRVQREKEHAALKMVQSLAASLNLHCTVEDVEYQFDMNKLTIFVRRSAKNAFVDFRKLQRGLFREFRCRIWCSYMDEVETIEQGPRSR